VAYGWEEKGEQELYETGWKDMESAGEDMACMADGVW